MTKKNKFNIFDYFGEVTYSFYTLKDSTTDYYGEVIFHFYNAERMLVTEFTNKNQIDEIIEFEEKRIKGFERRGFPLVFDDAHTQRRIWNPKRHISILKEPKVEYLKKAVESGRKLKSTKTTSRPVSQLESDEWDQIVAELIKKPDEESGRKLKSILRKLWKVEEN